MSVLIRRNASVATFTSASVMWAFPACKSRSLARFQCSFYSTDETAQAATNSPTEKSPFTQNSLYVLSVPITTHKSYIYCNHRSSLLDDSQLKTVPQIVRAENKVVGLATKAWNKLTASENSINKQIVALVRKLLNTIPYNENCLRSFPSKRAMIREINQEHFSELPKTVITSEIELGNYSLDQLKPIPVFHPRFQEPQAILDQLHGFRDNLGAFHRKWAVICAIGVPLTLPFAIVPVVPNVPGFYVAYRFYCHMKALMGVRNLGYLLESGKDDPSGPSVEDTTHLTFKACPELDVPFLANATFSKVKAQDSDENEQILITGETIDKLVGSIGLPQLREDLHRALSQETARLERELARDPVE